MSNLIRLDRSTAVSATPPGQAAERRTEPPAPAKAASAQDAVRAEGVRGVVPAVEASLVAVVVSPDRDHTFADLRPDVLRPISSWNELPAILRELREQAAGRQVVLDLAVHGNNGTGLKVVTSGVKGDIASITSIAEVNRMIRDAGFAPGEIVVLTEGCNVHRVAAVSRDGFTQSERQAAVRQAERLAASHGGKLDGAPEIVDRGPTEVDNDFEWRGRGPGTNWISTVLLQYLTGRTEGAPLHDLREYRDRQAPLETENDEVKWVDARRSEMVAQLRGTRFVAGGAPLAPPPVSERSEAEPPTPIARPGTRPVPVTAQPPTQAAPTQSPQPTQTTQPGVRFIDRIRQLPPTGTQPAYGPAQTVPVQPGSGPTRPAAGRPAYGSPQPVPNRPGYGSPPPASGQPTTGSAQPPQPPAVNQPMRFIDRLRLQQPAMTPAP